MFWAPGQPSILPVDSARFSGTVVVPEPAAETHNEKGVDPQVVHDLVGLLLKATRKLPLDEPFREVVLDYLRRKDLQPSPLREDASS